MTDDLRALVADELASRSIRASRRWRRRSRRGTARRRARCCSTASCLREKQLDGLMLDFYLIVSDYRAAYDKAWLAPANCADPAQRLPVRSMTGSPPNMRC